MRLRNGITKDMTIKEALEIADQQIAEENKTKFWNNFDWPLITRKEKEEKTQRD